MTKSSQPIIILVLVVIIATVVFLVWQYRQSSAPSEEQKTEQLIESISEASPVTERISEVSANPAEQLPELNPVEKTNPFKYQNPFE